MQTAARLNRALGGLMGRHNPYQERLAELTIDELLDEMDDYGIAHYMIHEAAKRIRSLIASQQAVQSDGLIECRFCGFQFNSDENDCPLCGVKVIPMLEKTSG